MQRVAVIGGGINGAGIAWELARRGYAVTLFDKGSFGGATSSATSKLIHGGLRYLEHFEFGLVRESLRERAFLLEHLPDLVRPLEFLLPVYRGISRPAWMIGLGLTLYDFLAAGGKFEKHHRLSSFQLLAMAPLRADGLRGGFRFFDAQVDDSALTRRVVDAAVRDGLEAREFTEVKQLARSGEGWNVNGERFDAVVIAAGPWMNQFLAAHGISTRYQLTLVRGSHIILGKQVTEAALMLQSPDDGRVFFVLPWQQRTLIGTTERLHTDPPGRVQASPEEIDYLIERFNLYIAPPISREDVQKTTSGVRPLIGGGSSLGGVSREYKIETDERLIKVFGGKMTTFLSLARRAADNVDAIFGTKRTAKAPIF